MPGSRWPARAEHVARIGQKWTIGLPVCPARRPDRSGTWAKIDHYHRLRHGDANDPDFFLNHPDPYKRALERALRGVPPE